VGYPGGEHPYALQALGAKELLVHHGAVGRVPVLQLGARTRGFGRSDPRIGAFNGANYLGPECLHRSAKLATHLQLLYLVFYVFLRKRMA